MNRAEFGALMNNVFTNEINTLREAGQKEYAGGGDAFGNFNRLAGLLQIPREKILLTYAMKHMDGIFAYVNGHTSQREPVEGRINDMIVYLFLLRGMVEENKQPKPEQTTVDVEAYRRT